MSDYFVVTPKGAEWSNWRELADRAQIVVPEQQLALGDELFSKNEPPRAQEELVRVIENFSPSYPAQDFDGFGNAKKPLHPAIMLTLLTALDTETVRRWTYPELVSSYLLADSAGKIYFFYFNRDDEGQARRTIAFLPAKKHVYRCMYAWGHEKETRFVYKEDETASRLAPA